MLPRLPSSLYVLRRALLLASVFFFLALAAKAQSPKGWIPRTFSIKEPPGESSGISVLRTSAKIVTTPLRFVIYLSYYAVRTPARLAEYSFLGQTGESLGRSPEDNGRGIGPVVW